MSGQYPGREETNPKRLAQAICDLYEGRSNAFGRFTVTEDAVSTTVVAPNCGPDSLVFLTPISDDAAAEYVLGTTYIAEGDVVAGAFTVTHPNDPSVLRRYGYAIVG